MMDRTSQKIDSMRVGGHKLSQVKQSLQTFVAVGTTFEQIEAEAQRLIRKQDAVPSFSTVPGYSWATCVMKNDALLHGIPQDKVVEDGDIVTVDVGLIENGYHLDTSITFPVGKISAETEEFLAVGKKLLQKAISRVKDGVSVHAISSVFEKGLTKKGYGAVYQFTGHGVGKELHMSPSIPCIAVRSDKKVFLSEGDTVAIEIMYTAGDPEVVLDDDGWTYRTKDGSLSAMFEETVLVKKDGFDILTRLPL